MTIIFEHKYITKKSDTWFIHIWTILFYNKKITWFKHNFDSNEDEDKLKGNILYNIIKMLIHPTTLFWPQDWHMSHYLHNNNTFRRRSRQKPRFFETWAAPFSSRWLLLTLIHATMHACTLPSSCTRVTTIYK